MTEKGVSKSLDNEGLGETLKAGKNNGGLKKPFDDGVIGDHNHSWTFHYQDLPEILCNKIYLRDLLFHDKLYMRSLISR